jgi:hypothetical protein
MTADVSIPTSAPATKPRSRSKSARSRSRTAAAITAAANTGRIPPATATGTTGNIPATAGDFAALDRLSAAYLRGGNGQRTLGTITVLEFLGWATEYAHGNKPRTMTAGGASLGA